MRGGWSLGTRGACEMRGGGGRRSLQRLAPGGHVVFAEQPRAEHDLLRHFLSGEDFQGHPDRLLPAGGILKRGVEDSLLDIGDSFVRQGVDPDEDHLRLCPADWAAR